jgi:cell division protein FtsX
VALMAVGSVVMWLGVPLALVYAASKLADSSRPSMGPYLLVIVGLPVGMALVGKVLGWLDRRHQALTGVGVEGRRSAPWMRSMRGERTSTRRGGVLDRVMIVSVAVALVLFGLWFFALAGSSLPGA